MSEPSFEQVVRMLRWTAHHAYGFTLISGPPKTKQWFDRLKDPRVGDLVYETTTIHQPQHDMDGIGYLLRVEWEKVAWPNDPEFVWDEEAEGEPHPTEKVWYLRTLDGREARWTNAHMIVVPTYDVHADLR